MSSASSTSNPTPLVLLFFPADNARTKLPDWYWLVFYLVLVWWLMSVLSSQFQFSGAQSAIAIFAPSMNLFYQRQREYFVPKSRSLSLA
jgi:hypothetical protein